MSRSSRASQSKLLVLDYDSSRGFVGRYGRAIVIGPKSAVGSFSVGQF